MGKFIITEIPFALKMKKKEWERESEIQENLYRYTFPPD